MKNEVGERLRHGSDVWDIVSHHHIVKCKIRRGSKWQVTNHQAVYRVIHKQPFMIHYRNLFYLRLFLQFHFQLIVFPIFFELYDLGFVAVCIYTDNSLKHFYLANYRKERQTKVRMKEENNINKERNSCTWLPSCFVHDDQVCDIVGSTGLNECRDLVVPSVHALSSRKYQLHLLQQ